MSVGALGQAAAFAETMSGYSLTKYGYVQESWQWTFSWLHWGACIIE